ncbi:MAG: IS3 family transposase [Burkholderiaceae bacterium]
MPERRRCVAILRNEYGVSERRACQAMQMNRSSYRYRGQRELVDEKYRQVIKLSNQYSYWGYRKVYDLMRRKPIAISRERVRHIRRHEGLQVRQKRHKRRLLGQTTKWANRAQYPNHVWSYDFVFDQTDDSRQLKCLTVVDEFTRHALTVHVARSITAGDVVAILTDLFTRHGKPDCIRSDNGPELVSARVRNWLSEKNVGTHYIDPGSPWQNAYCESFNSILRTTCLDRCLFFSMTEARVVINDWLKEYNEIRPHGSLNGDSPAQFLRNWETQNPAYQPETLTM